MSTAAKPSAPVLRGASVCTQALARGVAALREAGVDAAPVLHAAGLGDAPLHDPESRIPFARFAAFYEHAARASGDPCFGLRAGARAELASYDVLGYAALASSTLGEALRVFARYLGVLEDGAEVTLRNDGEVAVLGYRLVDTAPVAARQITELGIAVLYRWTETLAGTGWRAFEIRFAHDTPGDLRAYREVFGATPRFRAGENAVVFAAAALEGVLASGDPRLRHILERDLARTLAALPQPGDEVDAARRAVAGLLAGGAPTIDRVAGVLGISARTLQRRLAAHGTSHSALLAELRAQLACDYLRHGERSIGEIALLLGYTEISAFHRAFRRWTGRAPRAWRQANAGAKGQEPGASGC